MVYHKNITRGFAQKLIVAPNKVQTFEGLEIFYRYHGIAHLPVEFLNHGVVGELVRHKESALGLTPIGVKSLLLEDILINVDVVHIHSPVEGQGDHHRDLGDLEVAWDLGSVGGAEAVGQAAVGVVADRGRVRVVLGVAPTLVTPVEAVWVSVTEQLGR